MHVYSIDKVFTICKELAIPYVFKASYKKANRTSANSFTGLGDETGLDIIKRTAQKLNLPSTTDIHSDTEAKLAANYVDILQYRLSYAAKLIVGLNSKAL